MKTGRERSNALRGTIFTEPASAAPEVSGVGENETSTRAMPLIDTISTAAARAMPLIAVASAKPSSVTGTFSAGAPLIEISRALPPA